MKAFLLTANGKIGLTEVPDPVPGKQDYIIKVEAFGFNFADIMAIKGLYKDRPGLPCILGYDVTGRVESAGAEADASMVGKKVLAFTRFGGYAEKVCVSAVAIAELEEQDTGKTTALATQYCTAYFSMQVSTHVIAGETVLVHAAAGGVGQALMEIARGIGANPVGLVGSEAKKQLLAAEGFTDVHVRNGNDFPSTLTHRKFDAIFDSLGGKSVKKGMKMLSHGGRMVCFGAATRNSQNIFRDIGLVLGFGFYSPIGLMLGSKGLIGVNMLRIADHRPEILQHCLDSVVKLWKSGSVKIPFSQGFPVSEFDKARDLLASGRSAGKIYCEW